MELSIIINIIIVVPFIILGTCFIKGKGLSLIFKYNIMSENEKEDYDVEAIGKFIGRIFFVVALCLSLWGISEVVKLEILFTVSTCLFFLTLIFALLYLNAEERFKK